MSTTPRLAIVGCTGSGKSFVAMKLAAARPDSEIISVDAFQVYRALDIGTAKPTAADRAAVRHHCIDLVEPTDEFSLPEFVIAYRNACNDVAERGHHAIVVGGTGLYLRTVLDRFVPPGSWPEIRADLEATAAEFGQLSRLYQELVAADPAAAAKIEPNNARRIVRALEVCRGSGQQFSSFGPGLGMYPGIPTRQIGLHWDRAELGRRIEARVHQQIDNGWLEEVSAVRDRLGKTAAQVIGYRELIEHLDGRCSLGQAIAAIALRTRQFAVRQERWFRRDPRIEWYSGPAFDTVVASVLSRW